MKNYKQYITLNKNARGCYIIDTVKGCGTCLKTHPNGCYDECYAFKIAQRYNFDFSKSTIRKIKYEDKQLLFFGLKDSKHLNEINKQISNANMPFIRIGEMGDPSECWEHTINVCKEIQKAGKKIVIVTKHWNNIPEKLLKEIEKIDLCINTSISALDSEEQIHNRLKQFYILKTVCNSVLRVVSCDFNKENKDGICLSIVQDELFKHKKNIDTIFRCSKNNTLVKDNIIKILKVKFLNSYVYASIYNKNTYFGNCDSCPDMCGLNLVDINKLK